MFTALLVCASSIDLPKWPRQYHLKGTWNIPYWQIREPFYVETDTINNRQYEDSYNGLYREAFFVEYRRYTIQTSPTGPFCTYANLSKSTAKLIEYLPSGPEWVYEGERIVLGRKCHSWKKDLEFGYFYRFFADLDTLQPVRYHMHGRSIRGSHPADYFFDIDEFGPSVNELNYVMPSDCEDVTVIGPTAHTNDIRKPIRLGDEQDWCPVYTPPKVELPKEFSWREVPGVVGPPTDQANCGSCWAHSAAQMISSQFSLHHKGNVTISSQQLVDCTWGEKVNYGCMGGEGWATFKYLMNNKVPIASEIEYPYLGVTGQCQTTIDNPIGYVIGCKQVVVGDKDALKRALYLQGPIMVSILASHDSFVYYKGGLYDDPMCIPTPEDPVDHGVLLTGWKIVDGKEAFEIKNSWSDLWGDHGFGYISAGENDCGITSMAVLAEVKLAK